MTRKIRKRVTAMDRHIGRQLEQARQSMGLSANSLSDMVDVSHQQIRKYERGFDRISASSLYQFAKALNLPITFFYHDLSNWE